MIGGYQLNEMQNGKLIRFFPGEKQVNIGDVEEALRFLDNKYLYDTDVEALTDDALTQIFSRLDPYSVYIPPKNLVDVNNNMEGNYKGIGIETIILRDTLVVTRVLDESPAKKAGIQKLDHIIALNGKAFVGKDLDFPAFRRHFQTQTDTSVLTLLRPVSQEIIDLSLFSELVRTRSINHHVMLDDSTLYVRIDQFIARTYQEFMQVLEARQINGSIPRLIIDLRDNPGGYLGEVTKILSQFFDESKKTLVKTIVRNGRERKYETTGRTFYQVGKIVVLINGNSASGSEVLAGALQDWDRGLIIGRSSYGKGLVQEQYPLNNGGAVRLTVANYFLPSGRSIQSEFELDSSFFHVDSIWENGNDSYYSLINRRPLTGGNGIVPDVIVKDSFYEKVFYPAFYTNTIFDEWALEYLYGHPDLFGLSNKQFMKQRPLEVSDERLTEFVEEHSFLDRSAVITLFRAKLANYLFEDDMVLKIILENDPDITMALEKMDEENWFLKSSS